MKASFRGESVHKLDAKGRLSIPAPFRRELEKGDPEWESGRPQRFFLVYGHADKSYLEGFSVESMARMERRIRKMDRSSTAYKLAVHTYSTCSMVMELDPTGRIVLPAERKEQIGATDEIQFLGELDTFRVTTPNAFDAKIADLYAQVVPGDPATDFYAALGTIADEDDE